MKEKFQSIKQHHKETFEKAVEAKKADTPIIPLCRFFSETENFFTSSSCSGRIALLKLGKNQTKKKASFHKRWHGRVSFSEFWNSLKERTTRQELWLKQEPFILHIGTNSLENAKKILSIMKKAGIKRGGIMLAENEKFMLEITGTHNLTLPLKKKNRLLVTKTYLKLVLEKCNKKMSENEKRLKKFEELCRKELD